jgi:hypothetical protein
MLAGEKGSEGGVGAAPPPVTRALLLLLRILQARQHHKVKAESI